MNQNQVLIAGSTLGFLGVAIGAFGAHALKNQLALNGRIETFELAVRYQFYHALALLIIGLLMEKLGQGHLRLSSFTMFAGVILFSGSLYLFALTNQTLFAMITPLGGLLMLFGWATLAYAVYSKTR